MILLSFHNDCEELIKLYHNQTCHKATFHQERSYREVGDKALELSKWSDGDGVTILDVAKLALTDINYHHEARILHRIQQLIMKNEQDFELIWGDRIDILDKAVKER